MTDGPDDDSHDEELFEPELKPPAVVAKRFATTVLMADLADSTQLADRTEGMVLRNRAFDHLVALGLSPDDLESAERRMVFGLRKGHLDRTVLLGAMWRIEAAGVFSWALGLRGAILETSESADPAHLRSSLPADAGGLRELGQRGLARSLRETMAARNEWATRWFPIEHDRPSEARSRVLERCRALRWLTETGQIELCTTPLD